MALEKNEAVTKVVTRECVVCGARFGQNVTYRNGIPAHFVRKRCYECDHPRVPDLKGGPDGIVPAQAVREWLAGCDLGVAISIPLKVLLERWYWQAQEKREQAFAASWRGHPDCMDELSGLCGQCIYEQEQVKIWRSTILY